MQEFVGDNVITKDIWGPKYNFSKMTFGYLTEYFRGNLGMRRTVAVLEKKVPPSISRLGVEGISFNFLSMNWIIIIVLIEYLYNGEKHASIRRTEEFTASFYCSFELELFPFDVHKCLLPVSIINEQSSISVFDFEVNQSFEKLIYGKLPPRMKYVQSETKNVFD